MTPDDSLSVSDLALFASIAAACFGIASQLVRALVEYLKGVLGSKGETSSVQSAQCHFEHKDICTIQAAQNANIEEMLKQNGKLLQTVSDSSHSAQLRHEIMLAKLDKTHGRIEDIHEIVANQR